MEVVLGILQVLGIFLVLPALVGVVIAGLFILSGRRASATHGIGQLMCTVDADCPDGYVCRNGFCVPATPQHSQQ